MKILLVTFSKIHLNKDSPWVRNHLFSHMQQNFSMCRQVLEKVKIASFIYRCSKKSSNYDYRRRLDPDFKHVKQNFVHSVRISEKQKMGLLSAEQGSAPINEWMNAKFQLVS